MPHANKGRPKAKSLRHQKKQESLLPRKLLYNKYFSGLTRSHSPKYRKKTNRQIFK